MSRIFHSVCQHDCPDTCGLLVTVEDDRVISVKGDPDHPYTRGALCVKVNQYPERLYSPLRVTRPLKRSGPKGTGRFVPISWGRALDEIADRYKSIIAEYGAEAILPYSYAGTEGVIHFHAGHAFFHKLGASKLNRTICSAAFGEGVKYSLGKMPTTDIESTVDSDLIVIWGSNTLTTNVHAWPFFMKAKKRGADIIVVDPYTTLTAKRADIHLRLKAGTDAALALGIMHVIIDEDMIDRDFIAEHTLGFERLKERVREYPPQRVSRLTNLSVDDIKRVGRLYGKAKAPFIRLGYGTARQINGGMAVRTVSLLPGLVGATHKKGGGITANTSAAFQLDLDVLTREDLAPGHVRTINMVELGRALTGDIDPPVKAIHVYHCNPAVVVPESSNVLAGLKRDDLFIVVQELYMTETALMADIILPGASGLESTDLYRAYGHYYLQMARPVIPPVGEGRSTLWIFQALANRFGFTEECFCLDDETLIKRILPKNNPYFEGITFDRLSEGRPLRMNVPENPFAAGFATPSGRIEFYSEQLAQSGYDPLPDGSPSVDTDGVGKYPLQLITPPRHYFLNSSFNETPSLQSRAGRPYVLIHPADATDRNIEEDEVVRVFNDRGECYLHAKITENTACGLTVIEGLYWPRFMPLMRGANQLTSARLTDMGGSCAFHCNLVEVEPAT
jgi:anaerobic selenocysteine-containing dehydrogenase